MPSSALNDSADTDIEDEYEYIDVIISCLFILNF